MVIVVRDAVSWSSCVSNLFRNTSNGTLNDVREVILWFVMFRLWVFGYILSDHSDHRLPNYGGFWFRPETTDSTDDDSSDPFDSIDRYTSRGISFRHPRDERPEYFRHMSDVLG